MTVGDYKDFSTFALDFSSQNKKNEEK